MKTFITRLTRSLQCLLYGIVISTPLMGQTHLVKDINQTSLDGHPPGNYTMGTVGNYMVFAAYSSLYGTEVWRTDGTPEGTALLKDVTPGPQSSYPNHFITIDGTLFFTSSSDFGPGTNAIWKTDGTPDGTVMVYENGINPFNANGTLYFWDYGNERLMKYTTAGGVELVSSSVGHYAINWTYDSEHGIAYFSEYYNDKFWRTDGTPEGTYVVANMRFTTEHTVNERMQPPVLHGSVIFPTYNPTTGEINLMQSNGTAAGTHILKDLTVAGGSIDLYPRNFTVVNNIVYFTVENTNDGQVAFGRELWRTDGTAGGTHIVKDIKPGPSAGVLLSDSTRIPSINGILYFPADDGVHGMELWRSDGTEAGTQMVADIISGPAGSFPRDITVVNNRLYFTIDNGLSELWVSDGTEASTQILKDINPGGSSRPSDLTNINGRLYFFAYHDDYGRELWKSDGTPGTTSMVRDIGAGTQSNYLPSGYYASNGLQYFIMGGEGNYEVWRSDATTAGTFNILPASLGLQYTEPDFVGTYQDELYFFLALGGNTSELWKTNGQPSSTIRVAQNFPRTSDYVFIGPVLYYTNHNDPVAGSELWKYDARLGINSLVKDIHPGEEGSFPDELTNVNGVLFFTADAGNGSGRELWKCENGEASGTLMVKDIHSDDDFYPDRLTNVNGTLYFRATTDQHGQELWKSDGTFAGTTVIELVPGPESSGLEDLKAAGNVLYVTTFPEGTPNGLYKCEGTNAVLIAEFENKGIEYLTPASADLVYFEVWNFEEGVALWKTDGTPEGTSLLRQLTTRYNDLSIDAPTVVDGRLFFTFNNVLWKSEGHPCNTVPLTDLASVAVGEFIASATTNGKLLFEGTNATSGYELFAYDFSNIDKPGCTQSIGGFDGDLVKIYSDAPFLLEASATSGLPVTYVAEHPEIARIDGNVVTIISAGETTIMARQEGDKNYAAAQGVSRILRVGKAQAQFVIAQATFTYDGHAKSAVVATQPQGLDGIQLEYRQGPSTIDSPVNAGLYQVTASLSNTNYSASAHTFDMTIEKAGQQVVFEAPAEKIFQVDEPFVLTASATSGGTVTFTSSDPSVATVNGNIVTLTGAGTSTLTAFQEGNENYHAATPVTHALTVILITGTEESIDEMISVYPNPATDHVVIESKTAWKHAAAPCLLDLQGRKVARDATETSNFSYRLDIGTLQPGVYLLQVQQAGRTTFKKITVR